MYEQNPLYHGPFPAPASAADPLSEENIPDHCRPLSPDRDGLDSSSEDPSPGAPETSTEGLTDGDNAAFTEAGQEPSGAPAGSGPPDAEQQYTSELIISLSGQIYNPV